MKHEKTFEAISKLKDIEIELHRLKNALELANKMLDAQRTWVGLTDDEVIQIRDDMTLDIRSHVDFYRHCEAKLKEKNT